MTKNIDIYDFIDANIDPLDKKLSEVFPENYLYQWYKMKFKTIKTICIDKIIDNARNAVLK